MVWSKILLTELVCIFLVMFGLGIFRIPRFLTRRKLSSRFPWGYYPDQVPQEDPGYGTEKKDFLHDTGTEFGGLDVYGEYGEFSGFGELGEYGSSFFGE
jgi:hypothetical protein